MFNIRFCFVGFCIKNVLFIVNVNSMKSKLASLKVPFYVHLCAPYSISDTSGLIFFLVNQITVNGSFESDSSKNSKMQKFKNSKIQK